MDYVPKLPFFISRDFWDTSFQESTELSNQEDPAVREVVECLEKGEVSKALTILNDPKLSYETWVKALEEAVDFFNQNSQRLPQADRNRLYYGLGYHLAHYSLKKKEEDNLPHLVPLAA